MKKISVFMILGLCAIGAFAQKPLSFYASQEVSFDDNIYLTKEDKKTSGISATTAGVDYSSNIPGTGLDLALNGKGAYNAYTEDSAKNNYFDALASASLGNSIFNISDTFLYTADPANSELTDRAKRIRNAADILVNLSANKPIGIGFFGGDVWDKYLDDEFERLSKNALNGGLRLYYNISPKTNVFAEYTHTAISYDKTGDRDSATDGAGLGINGQIAAKVKGSAKITFDSRTYDKKIANRANKPTVFGYNLMLIWQPSTQNALRLSGERKMEDTIYSSNRHYITTGVSLTFMQKILDKLEASLTAGYENMAYPEFTAPLGSLSFSKREDNLIKIRPALDYKFQKWLSAGVWYQYKSRSSNQDFDYDSNKAGAYLKVIF